MDDKKPINSTQIKLIHIAKSKLKIGDDDYRTMLSERYWVNTSKELSYKDASDLIDHLKTLGFKITHREEKQKKPYNWDKNSSNSSQRQAAAEKIVKLPTFNQIDLIADIREDIMWHVADGFRRWLEKYLGRQLEDGKQWKSLIHSSKEAQYVIEALKGMKGRQARAASAKAQDGQYYHDSAVGGGGHAEW